MEGSALSLGFIGAGRVANALAIALHEKGYRITAVANRTLSSAEALAAHIGGCIPHGDAQAVADGCELVFITTPDDAIEVVASEVRWREGAWVVHCSGAGSTAVLEGARGQGASVGALHPMQTFPNREEATARLSGIAFAVEAEGALADTLKGIALALGGWPVEIRPQDRPLYHLSGFLACGAVINLAAQATEVWRAMGYSREEGLKVLLPLLKATVEQLELQGIPDALTGPIARGDIGTVRKHLEALEEKSPDTLPIYCQASQGAVRLARERGGIDDHRSRELNELLESYLLRAART